MSLKKLEQCIEERGEIFKVAEVEQGTPVVYIMKNRGTGHHGMKEMGRLRF